MKKIAILVVVLIVVGAGVWYFLYGQGGGLSLTPPSPTEVTTTIPVETQTSDTDTQPAENTISYTSNGFSPQILTVKAGTTVVFTNDSQSAIQVASNPHPVHTDFSDFDAKSPHPPGKDYSFTFTEAGSYGFHNHLKSSHKGTIVVE